MVLRHDTAIQLCCRAAAIRAVCPALQRDSILQVAPVRLRKPFPNLPLPSPESLWNLNQNIPQTQNLPEWTFWRSISTQPSFLLVETPWLPAIQSSLHHRLCCFKRRTIRIAKANKASREAVQRSPFICCCTSSGKLCKIIRLQVGSSPGFPFDESGNRFGIS